MKVLLSPDYEEKQRLKGDIVARQAALGVLLRNNEPLSKDLLHPVRTYYSMLESYHSCAGQRRLVKDIRKGLKRMDNIKNIRIGEYEGMWGPKTWAVWFTFTNLVMSVDRYEARVRMPDTTVRVTPNEVRLYSRIPGVPWYSRARGRKDIYRAHPHALSRNQVCFGDYTSMIRDLCLHVNIEALAALLRGFLETVDPADAAGNAWSRYRLGDPNIRFIPRERYPEGTVHWSRELSRWGIYTYYNGRFYVSPCEYVLLEEDTLSYRNYSEDLREPLPDIRDRLVLDQHRAQRYKPLYL